MFRVYLLRILLACESKKRKQNINNFVLAEKMKRLQLPKLLIYQLDKKEKQSIFLLLFTLFKCIKMERFRYFPFYVFREIKREIRNREKEK